MDKRGSELPTMPLDNLPSGITMEALLERCVKCPALETIDAQTFRQKYYNEAPIVLKKCAENWKPCDLWTPGYLKTALKGAFDELEVLESNDNKHFIDNSEFTTRKNVSPGDFIDYVFNESDIPTYAYHKIEKTRASCREFQPTSHRSRKLVYLRTYSMPKSLYIDIAAQSQIASLKNKIYSAGDVDDFSQAVFRQDTMQLWISTAGNATPIHYDRNHGLLFQISGDKRVILFSHEDTSCLYPYPSHSPISHVSRVKFRDLKDQEELGAYFPKFVRTRPYSCVISKGDILYTPPFWWHDVTSLDNCVSVTLPWDLNSSDEIPACMLR